MDELKTQNVICFTLVSIKKGSSERFRGDTLTVEERYICR